MRMSDSFFEQCEEEYFVYLDSVKEDEDYMDYKAFTWMKMREVADDRAELLSCD